MTWKIRDEKYVWHPFTQIQTEPTPLHIVRAKNAVLYASDGKTYLDCNSSWWVNVHGHGNEHIAKAIQEQFEKVDHIIFAGATHDKGIELAERVAKLLPDSLEKVFFSDNGSTAVEVAIKMCIQYWHNKGSERKKILALEGAYHGDTFGAMSVGERDYFNRPFEPFFFDVDYLPFPTNENSEEIARLAKQKLQENEYVALIVEPIIQGSAGMRTYPISFLESITKTAQSLDVPVIFDEVMTAWGRTGTYFAFEHTQVVPDIICLSKGLTGGVLPLGLTVTTNKLFEAFLSPELAKAFLHGHSFTGNPLACAAACASLDLFENESTWKAIKRISDANLAFSEHISIHPKVKSVRVFGTILALDIDVSDPGYFSSFKRDAYSYFLEQGLLMRPLGNVLFINPPYCLSADQQAYIFEKLEAFLNS